MMAQSTIYDLLEKTLKNMPRPATTHEVYLELVKNGAYKHMDSKKARKIISAKLCYMRDKGVLVCGVSADKKDKKTVWDIARTLKFASKPDAIEQQPIIVHTIGKPLDNTHVLQTLFLDISAAFAKAANGLISHDK
jgi:hypothetical protein